MYLSIMEQDICVLVLYKRGNCFGSGYCSKSILLMDI